MRTLALVAGGLLAGAIPAGADDQFETRVRPVLAEHCYGCHGPRKQSSGLRLDSREAMVKGGEVEGAAIVPGDAEASPLVKAIRHSGELKMPPKSPMDEAKVHALSEWVKAGAPWPKDDRPAASAADAAAHWAFQPVHPPEVPAGPRSPIDALIDAKIAEAKLTPGPRADRLTLIRRATFDLTGLPPTAREVDDFLGDPDPDAEAFAEVVDRLLASPHYGERWGRHWLDVARYADTKGYVFTEDKNYPFSYTYRDWVVSAFNDDMPYDRFILHQIAGDKMPAEPDNRDLAAMGFLTVGRRFLNDKNEIIDDRIDLVSRGLLGLSVACARCHDHKFDPIPTEDYYSLYGVFDSSEEPAELPILHAAGKEKDSVDYDRKLSERKRAVESFVDGKRAELQGDLRGRVADYLVAADALGFDPRSGKLDEAARGARLRPELLRRLAARWKGRLAANDPALEPWKALAALPAEGFREKAAQVAAAMRAGQGGMGAREEVAGALAEPPVDSRGDLARRYGAILAKAIASPADPDFDDLRRWLESPEGPLTIGAGDVKRLLNRAERNTLRDLDRKLVELDAAHPGAPAKAMVMVDQAKPHDANIFIRGNADRPGKLAPRRFLKILSPADRPSFSDKESGRLALAQAIVDPKNPLTARVMANRIWMQHFGQGLVRTPSDYGLRGDPPTNPALLDWLAAAFVEGGWSIKGMHRRIMLSDAYARTSRAAEADLRVDPTNALLARQNRRRLDFESTRDALLAVGGALDPRLGGKAVPLEAEPFTTRRTMYGYIDRYNIDPLFRTFDFPNPDSTSPRRQATTVPQQALYLLNSPFVAEQARRLAHHPEVGDGPDEDRVRRLHRHLFGRDAGPREVELARAFLDLQSTPGRAAPAPSWRYATCGVEEAGGRARVSAFRPFPHFTGKAYQATPMLPGPDYNFANLTASGGHPGPNPDKAVAIRWVAPADLVVSASGTLHHPEAQGDGVRARLVSDRSGLLGTWEAHNSRAETAVDRIEVKAGEALDFVVDCRGGEAFDSFSFAPSIRVVGPPPAGLGRASWDARAEFEGPPAPGLSPWEAYAQALLLTNEFLFVD